MSASAKAGAQAARAARAGLERPRRRRRRDASQHRRPARTLAGRARQAARPRSASKQCEELFHDWSLWARPDQTPPPGDWIYWLILAGRGAGKTRAGAEAVREWTKTFAHRQPDRRDARRRARHHGARRIRTDGDLPARRSGRATRAPPRRLAWPNGAVSQLFSAEEPDRLRGKQHMKLWLRRTRRVAPPRRLRPGAARPAPRRQAAGGDHHDAAADQDHQAARRGQGRDRHARLDLRQRPSSRRRRSSSASPRATPAARSAARSCSPKSSRRRPARCGRAR